MHAACLDHSYYTSSRIDIHLSKRLAGKSAAARNVPEGDAKRQTADVGVALGLQHDHIRRVDGSDVGALRVSAKGERIGRLGVAVRQLPACQVDRHPT